MIDVQINTPGIYLRDAELSKNLQLKEHSPAVLLHCHRTVKRFIRVSLILRKNFTNPQLVPNGWYGSHQRGPFNKVKPHVSFSQRTPIQAARIEQMMQRKKERDRRSVWCVRVSERKRKRQNWKFILNGIVLHCL